MLWEDGGVSWSLPGRIPYTDLFFVTFTVDISPLFFSFLAENLVLDSTAHCDDYGLARYITIKDGFLSSFKSVLVINCSNLDSD